MRICMIVSRMDPFYGGKVFMGGAIKPLISLCNELKNHGHQVIIIAGTFRNSLHILSNTKFPWVDEIQPISINSPLVSVKHGIEFTSKCFLKIAELHRRVKFDIIHMHSGYAPYVIIPAMTKRFLKIPSFYHLYSPIMSNGDMRSNAFVMKTGILRLTLSYLDRVFVPSKNVARSLELIGLSPRKVRIIPPSINDTSIPSLTNSKKAREKLGIGQTSPLICYIGNLSKKKGLDILIQAMIEVVKHHKKSVLLAILDPREDKMEEKWKTLVKESKIPDNLMKLGAVKNINELILASDIFVAPFRSTEGIVDYPTSVLEAMALGKPVVASRIGGIPEIIKHERNGILLEPNNVDLLSAYILTLIENRILQERLGANASKFISDNFSISRTTQIVEETYKQARSI